MKKKIKPAKDQLIDSLLEDLKQDPSGSDGLEGNFSTPLGLEVSGVFPGEKKPSLNQIQDEKESSEEILDLNVSEESPKNPLKTSLGSLDKNSIYENINQGESEDKTTLLDSQNNLRPNENKMKSDAVGNEGSRPSGPPVMSHPPQMPVSQPMNANSKPSANPFASNANKYEPRKNPFLTTEGPVGHVMPSNKPQARQSTGSFNPAGNQASAPPAHRDTTTSNRFLKIENARMAQERIQELEQELERMRKENEMLSSSHEITKSKLEELLGKNMQLEKQRNEFREASESELRIFREALQVKDSEIQKFKSKVEELNSRLSGDLRKIRVRERELENRLELAKVEKTALMRAKDETILELKRKQETMLSEIEGYHRKILELTEKIELNQEQFTRTVRALRLALTNLEVSEDTTTIVPISKMKKAE